MQPPLCQGPDPTARQPKHAIPAGTTDCHCHVFDHLGRVRSDEGIEAPGFQALLRLLVTNPAVLYGFA